VGEALDWTTDYFEKKDVGEARRSAEWLLSAATGLSRVELYAYHSRPLTSEERTELRESVARRAGGEPLQHVTGEVPFRHLVLHVRPGVFIPRPETEVLVDVGLEHVDRLRALGVTEVVALDLCTGSGAVACAVASEREDVRMWAVDVSEEAVTVACDNVMRAGLAGRVQVATGDLFEPIPGELEGEVHLILSNPPYIPTRDLAGLPGEVSSHEPAVALDGGLDGLTTVERVAERAPTWLAEGGRLAMEVDERTAAEAAAMLERYLSEVTVRRDLAGRDRVVTGVKEAGR
jgi:release factor glutamine methyltransferase